MLAAVVKEFTADRHMRNGPILDGIVTWITGQNDETIFPERTMYNKALVIVVSREDPAKFQIARIPFQGTIADNFRAFRELGRYFPADLHH